MSNLKLILIKICKNICMYQKIAVLLRRILTFAIDKMVFNLTNSIDNYAEIKPTLQAVVRRDKH